MTLINKVGREIDKKLDGWRGTSFLLFINITALGAIFGGLILLSAFIKSYL